MRGSENARTGEHPCVVELCTIQTIRQMTIRSRNFADAESEHRPICAPATSRDHGDNTFNWALAMAKQHSKSSPHSVAVLESFEVRRLLSTVIVNTLADETVANATTSLREAIQLASGGDTVSFAAGMTGTLTLGGQQLLIEKDLMIAGPGAAKLSISANNASRVFKVKQGTTVTMFGLTIKQGRADFAGGGINTYGVLTLNNVVVSDNTAAGANGTQEFPNGHEGWGGGIFNFGTLTLNNSTVTRNVAVGGAGAYGLTIGGGGEGFGGGILNGGAGSVTLTNSTLSNNQAIGGSGSDNGFAGSAGYLGHGGGIYSDGSNVYVTGGRFTGNRAIGGRGTSGAVDAGIGGDARGGAICARGGELLLTGVEFNDNAAVGGNGGVVEDFYASLPGGSAYGGAIFLGAVNSITRCTFTNNVAAGGSHSGHGSGGAVYATDVSVTDSTFDSNKAVGVDAEGLSPTTGGAASGGAISANGVLTITGSTLWRNSAVAGRGTHAVYWRGYEEPAADGGDAVGGAIAVSAPAFITRSTVYGNSLKGGAGGFGYDPVIMPAGDGGDARGAGIDATAGLSLTACTIAGNTAIAGLKGEQGGGGVNGQSFGGGVRGDNKLTFANTLIATNAADIGPDVSGEVLSMGLGFNLIGKSDGSSGWIASDKLGTVDAPLDPKLGPLASNGGPTKTMALLLGSPALDAGKAFDTSTDQRGATRPRNLAAVANAPGSDGADIGAFELQSLPPGQTPFKSFVVGATPLTIQVEDFDNGGEGVAYHDADVANTGGVYRSTGVDLAATTDTGGGYLVGWSKAGEWLEYTVMIEQSGYTLDFRVASNGPGGTFHFEFDGTDVTGPLTVPNTGGWQKWTTIKKDGAYLGAGTYVLRLKMDANGATGWVGNFNHLKITRGAVNLVTGVAAHVRDGSYRFANYGSSPALEVKKSTASYNRETYLKYDLTNVATVGSAKLRLYGGLTDTVAPSIQLGVFASSVTNWSESGITWNNKPATGASAVAGTTITGTTKKWYEIDVATYLQAEKAAGRNVVTFVLRSNTSTSTLCAFAADDVANGPRLVIQS